MRPAATSHPLWGARENPATGRSFLREGPLSDEALGRLRQLRAGAARSKKLCAHVMASTATAAGLAEGNPAALGAGPVVARPPRPI